jgi:hypothetical protein
MGKSHRGEINNLMLCWDYEYLLLLTTHLESPSHSKPFCLSFIGMRVWPLVEYFNAPREPSSSYQVPDAYFKLAQDKEMRSQHNVCMAVHALPAITYSI